VRVPTEHQKATGTGKVGLKILLSTLLAVLTYGELVMPSVACGLDPTGERLAHRADAPAIGIAVAPQLHPGPMMRHRPIVSAAISSPRVQISLTGRPPVRCAIRTHSTA
jgi:hypothetical protein